MIRMDKREEDAWLERIRAAEEVVEHASGITGYGTPTYHDHNWGEPRCLFCGGTWSDRLKDYGHCDDCSWPKFVKAVEVYEKAAESHQRVQWEVDEGIGA